MNHRSLAVLVSSLLLTACGATSGPVVPQPNGADGPRQHAHRDDGVESLVPPVTQVFPAPFRLGDEARPLSYDVALRIDPARATFSGEVSIAVHLTHATRLIRLHADGLEVSSATVDHGQGRMKFRVESDGHGNLGLHAPAALVGGTVELKLSYTGPLPETPVGIYRADEGGSSYVFTQFEPLEARRAFPCFDEPRFKVPFDVRISTPAGNLAVSNMPEVSAVDLADGWRTFTFARSPAMPTYLVAFAVGPFDVIAGEAVSSGRVPFRVLTTKGKGKLASFALERTPRYLDMLEGWFGRPYPYPKLDVVAVPSFSSSAMENVGLVTFREAVLLIDGERAPVDDRTRCESIIAHELAHMWFGNLVTMAWWDDLWLNEAFAVWMARKAVMAVSPDLDLQDQITRGKFNVMHADARPHARAIRQPIETEGDIYNAFDGITYSKGAAVLEMIEQWLGAASFQAGIRGYVGAHAGGNATTADLVRSLEAAAPDSVPDGEVGRVLASFTDKPGVPLVNLDWRCEADGMVALELQQRPWRALGDPRGEGSETWTLPVCALLSDGKQTGRHCGLLDAGRATWRTKLGFCPTFSHPNIGEAGYFRWETRHGPISIARAEPTAFAGLAASLRSGVDAGRVTVGQYLEGIAPLVYAQLSPSALGDVLGALGSVPRFAPEAIDDPRFHKKARAWLAPLPVTLDLGRTSRERRASPQILGALAAYAKDDRVLAQARHVTEDFLRALGDNTEVELELASIYVPMYLRSLGNWSRKAPERARIWTALEAGLAHANPSVRELVIEALGTFEEPELVVASLGLVLSDKLRAQDLRTVRAGLSWRPAVVEAVWTWLTTHFEPLVERLGAKAAPGLPWFAAGFCTGADAERVQAFFESKRDIIPSGLERNLAQVVEGIRTCEVLRKHHGQAARAWYQ